MIVVTGFEPFGNFKENPTEELARWSEKLGAKSVIVPVTFKGAKEFGRKVLEMKPDAVVSLGLAYGRPQISVEMVALNIMDSKQPDNDGYRPSMEKMYEDGEFSYQSTLPPKVVVDALASEGIPSYISYHAGTYVCNALLYSLLHNSKAMGMNIPIGFIHFPSTEKMALGKNVPYVEFETMKRALKIIIEVTSRLSSP